MNFVSPGDKVHVSLGMELVSLCGEFSVFSLDLMSPEVGRSKCILGVN